jgi:hypothetical protein
MKMDFYRFFGWMFVFLAAFFALGLTASLARHFYPHSPSFLRRLAGPLIFGLLAVACFMGIGRAALILVVLSGLTLIVISHWRRRNDRPAA